MFGFLKQQKPDPDPDTWTADRRRRLTALRFAAGDVAEAGALMAVYTSQEAREGRQQQGGHRED